MVRKVQGQAASDTTYYGYDQNQQYSEQNYYSYYDEQTAQGGQNTYNQQHYEQPLNNYQQTPSDAGHYNSQPASSYAQPYTGYQSNPSPIVQSYANDPYNHAAQTQPLVQEKSHLSPVVNSVPYGSYGQQARQVSWLDAFGTGGFEGEAPLLEELGINFGHIKNKTFASINPFRKLDAGALGDTDLAGPLLFCFLFGMSLLLSGKVHFGYIYGVATMGWLSVFCIINLMSEAGVSFYLTASVLGYCLLPMVLLSAISVLLKLRGGFGLIMAVASISWCTLSSSTLFVSAFNMKNQQVLIAYPIFLFYSCFALMTVF